MVRRHFLATQPQARVFTCTVRILVRSLPCFVSVSQWRRLLPAFSASSGFYVAVIDSVEGSNKCLFWLAKAKFLPKLEEIEFKTGVSNSALAHTITCQSSNSCGSC